VELYSGPRALEEVVKRAQRPRLLHLATHGFFISDQARSALDRTTDPAFGREDPMLRSGLFLAGADRALAGLARSADLEDGILNAYEASGLNLHGAELVVLSACETGLGEAHNSEGVFGLRRAFQLAGAEAVLMSMWAVPDRETQELMTRFYAHWLGGKNKHVALREAQQEMRQRVRERYQRDLPFYWAAFVLQGR
jgi:CHAT domain-containing protein